MDMISIQCENGTTAETPLNEIIDWDTCAQISKWAGGIGFPVLDEIKIENKSNSKSEEDFVICKPKKSLSKPNSLENNGLESKILETSKKGFKDPCWRRKETNIKSNVETEDLFECFSDPIVSKHLKDIVSGAADVDWFPRLFRVVKFIYQKEFPNCIPNSIVELFQPLEEFKKLCDVTSKESIVVSWIYSRKSCSKNLECCFPILWISPLSSFEDGYAGIGWEYFSVNVKIWCDKYAKSKNKILKHESKDKISESFLRYFATMKKPQD